MIEGILALLAVIVGLFIKGSFQKDKIEDLENENKHFKKENSIEKEMDKADRKAEKEEFDALSNVDVKDWKAKI